MDARPQEPASIGPFQGLAARLLVLTVAFVMLAEVLVFLPSVANFRNVWLQTHLDTAEAASIVYLDIADPMLSAKARSELLAATGSLAVVVRERGMKRLLAEAGDMPQLSAHIDLASTGPASSIAGALATLFAGEPRPYRVFGPMRSRAAAEIELVQDGAALARALRTYARNVALLSLAISLITAALVYGALYGLIVRPIRRISDNMAAFSREPDNAALILAPGRRRDEIGATERKLAGFEKELHSTLRQRQHLADLGLAVSKINHDLRNILASARLIGDRLAGVRDPLARSLTPKLVRAIDRATEYSAAVLSYGTVGEAAPRKRRHRLRSIVADVAGQLALDRGDSTVEWRNEVPAGLEAEVDAEQIFRALMNLCRNAVQAMERGGGGSAAVRRLSVSAARRETEDGGRILLRVADTGPGMDEAVRADLFKPFKKSGNHGAGLGLVIVAEIVRAHGGSIAVEKTSPAGTAFLVVLPAVEEAPAAKGNGRGAARQR